MGSLRNEAQKVLDEARDAICWIAVWKEGRSWHTSTLWLDYDAHTGRFTEIEEYNLDELRDIARLDPNAIIINGYHFNLGSLEEMTRDTLANALRWHYEDLHDAQLADTLIDFCGGGAE